MRYPEFEERLFDGCEHRLPPVYPEEHYGEETGFEIGPTYTLPCRCFVESNLKLGRFFRGERCDDMRCDARGRRADERPQKRH